MIIIMMYMPEIIKASFYINKMPRMRNKFSRDKWYLIFLR